MGDYNSSLYMNGFSSFEPRYASNFTGYTMNAKTLSSNTNPTVANQVKEVVARLKEGVQNIEFGTIDPKMLESMPKQQINEIRALMKLSKADISMHAPINGLDPSGATNNGFSEEERVNVERRLFESLKIAKDVSPDKGINVVMHSAVNGGEQGGMGAIFRPGDESKGEQRFTISQVGVIDKNTGKYLGQLKEDFEYKFDNPGDLLYGGTKVKPMDKMKEINETNWKDGLSSVHQTLQNFDIETSRGLGRHSDTEGMFLSILERTKNGIVNADSLNDDEKDFLRTLEKSQIHLRIAKDRFDDSFKKAYEYGTSDQKKDLINLANRFKGNMGSVDKNNILYSTKYREELDKAVYELDKITKDNVPMTLISSEEYAKNEASKTFGNLAWKGFNELGKGNADRTPVIAIENLYPGNTNATAEDLKYIIENSRKNFVKSAVKNGMDEGEAKDAAKKIIGATWDVGHLNMFKKEGFTDEDLVKQTKEIAKYVKHVHLTDNFGYADTHLAPGMGNVPFKEHLKELEKTGKLSEIKKVIEAGGLLSNQLTNSQLKPTLGSFGIPIYSGGGGYWSQLSEMAMGGGYFGGQGEILPDKHFSMYGSGFSSLPTSLGGQVSGNVSRATGTPMA